MKLVAPKGAFYAHPTLEIPEDDLTFVTDLLKQKHVLVVHGSGFGEKPGTRHMRIVFLPPEPVLSAAYDAMTRIHEGAVSVIRGESGNSLMTPAEAGSNRRKETVRHD